MWVSGSQHNSDMSNVKGDQMGLLWEAHVSALHMTGGRGVGCVAAAQSIFP